MRTMFGSEGFESGSTYDRVLRVIGRISIFLAPLTVLVVMTTVMVCHGKPIHYALWLAMVACIPVFVLVGVHLLGAMYRRVAEPRTATGIAIFLLFQGASYAAMFILALPWYFLLIPSYLLSRFIAGKVRDRRAERAERARLAKLAGQPTPGA